MTETRHRTLKDWVITTRPWSFTTSTIGIIVPAAYLLYLATMQGNISAIDWINVLLCLPLLVIVHAGGNLVSDYYDFTHGIDGPDCVNGVTWLHSGLFKPREILRLGIALLCVGCLIGLVLLWRSSISAWWIGALGLVLSLLYPLCKTNTLGDIYVLTCFGLLPSLGTGYVGTGTYHVEMMLYCLPYALHIVAILHSNNTRDIANDLGADCVTLSGVVGGRRSQWIYAGEILLPYLLVVTFITLCHLTPWLLLTLLTLPLAIKNVKTMLSSHALQGGIARLDQATAQFQMLFGITYALGFVAGALL